MYNSIMPLQFKYSSCVLVFVPVLISNLRCLLSGFSPMFLGFTFQLSNFVGPNFPTFQFLDLTF